MMTMVATLIFIIQKLTLQLLIKSNCILFIFFSFSLVAEEILPYCEIQNGKIVSNISCFAKIQIGDDFSYHGEFKNKKLNGKGTFTWHTNETYSQYEGEFKNDKLHGKGKLFWNNGDISNGNFIEGSQEGFGEKIFSSGDKYIGEFKDGVFHGLGKYIDITGDIYDGNFEQGNYNGFGKVEYKNGEQYAGGWKDGKKEGQGIWFSPNGSSYEGEWKGGLPHGRGTIINEDGTKLETNFFQGEIIK